MDEKGFDVVVIGGGPSGLSAAIAAALAGLTVCVCDGAGFGGHLLRSALLRWVPGLTPGTTGLELAGQLETLCSDCGVTLELELVETLSRCLDGPFRFEVGTATGLIRARAVVLATGRRNPLPAIEGYAALEGKGLSSCAVCDGPLFRGKTVAVVGGGDHAAEEALFLAEYAATVQLITATSADWRPGYNSLIGDQHSIVLHEHTTVTGLVSAKDERYGFERLTALDVVDRSADRSTAQTARIACAAAFIAPHPEPQSTLCAAQFSHIVMENGQIATDRHGATAQLGLFATGFVQSLSVAVCEALGDGTRTGRAVARFLAAGNNE